MVDIILIVAQCPRLAPRMQQAISLNQQRRWGGLSPPTTQSVGVFLGVFFKPNGDFVITTHR
ncbi:hypothetical protein AB9B82_19395, partial [Escherichia coli]